MKKRMGLVLVTLAGALLLSSCGNRSEDEGSSKRSQKIPLPQMEPASPCPVLEKRGIPIGSGSSEGGWGTRSAREIDDVAWIIDHWIPEQPWSSGKVGMYGPSYMGITSYLPASTEF